MVKTVTVTSVNGYVLNKDTKEMVRETVTIPYGFKSQAALENYVRKNIDSSFAVVEWDSYQQRYEMDLDTFISHAMPVYDSPETAEPVGM